MQLSYQKLLKNTIKTVVENSPNCIQPFLVKLWSDRIWMINHSLRLILFWIAHGHLRMRQKGRQNSWNKPKNESLSKRLSWLNLRRENSVNLVA